MKLLEEIKNNVDKGILFY